MNEAGGNLEKPFVAIGGEYRLKKIFTVSTGVNFGGNNGDRVNVPLGIMYHARKGFYEAGIAVRDINFYLFNIGSGSTLSFSTGFLRFKF
jgi:hypothetical protein